MILRPVYSSEVTVNELEKSEMKRREEIVSEAGGVLPYAEEFYLAGMKYAAERSTTAFKEADDAQGAPAVSLVHQALACAGELSRYFWPSWRGGVAMRRGERLRDAFALTDASPLADRRLRDGLEHFDERLDKFLLTIDAGEFFPFPIEGDARMLENPTQHFFKLLDRDRGVFILLNKAFSYQPIREEVERIQAALRASDTHLPRD